MQYDPNKHHRRSIRLKNYDYSGNGAYFVTLCTYNREHIFGVIINEEMILNRIGNIVRYEWIKSAKIRPGIEIDEFIVMPNHIHGILIINRRDDQLVIPTKIGMLIGGFKASATTKINKIRNQPGIPVWQRGYHEHIIRNDESLFKIREYITMNPINWPQDEMNDLTNSI